MRNNITDLFQCKPFTREHFWLVLSGISGLGNAIMCRDRRITISAYSGYRRSVCERGEGGCQWVRFANAIDWVFEGLGYPNHCLKAARKEGLL